MQSDAAVVRRTVGAPSLVLVFPPFDLVLYKLTELYKLAELIGVAATVRSTSARKCCRCALLS